MQRSTCTTRAPAAPPDPSPPRRNRLQTPCKKYPRCMWLRKPPTHAQITLKVRTIRRTILRPHCNKINQSQEHGHATAPGGDRVGGVNRIGSGSAEISVVPAPAPLYYAWGPRRLLPISKLFFSSRFFWFSHCFFSTSPSTQRYRQDLQQRELRWRGKTHISMFSATDYIIRSTTWISAT